MRTVIIEDEPKSLEYLKSLLAKHFKQVEVVATARDAEQGIAAIVSQQPDLVLLDIELPGRNGLEMLDALGPCQFGLVFITAFDHYALKAIKASPIDYVMKPLKLAELYQAITRAEQRKHDFDKAKQLEALLQNIKAGNDGQRIVLPTLSKTYYVSPNKITKVESSNGYTSFHRLGEKPITVSYGMHRYAEALDGYGFIRCGQSVFVNPAYVQCMNNTSSRAAELLMADGSIVIVPAMRKEMVRLALEGKK
jgi:two-component system LytT family response regulator